MVKQAVMNKCSQEEGNRVSLREVVLVYLQFRLLVLSLNDYSLGTAEAKTD